MTQPHLVIVGGGFGGLYAPRALRRAPVQVTLVDRRNHHLFQPLLYQVATAALNIGFRNRVAVMLGWAYLGGSRPNLLARPRLHTGRREKTSMARRYLWPLAGAILGAAVLLAAGRVYALLGGT